MRIAEVNKCNYFGTEGVCTVGFDKVKRFKKTRLQENERRPRQTHGSSTNLASEPGKETYRSVLDLEASSSICVVWDDSDRSARQKIVINKISVSQRSTVTAIEEAPEDHTEQSSRYQNRIAGRFIHYYSSLHLSRAQAPLVRTELWHYCVTSC
jgi:hypothetical protein